MSSPSSETAGERAKRWNLDIEQALYAETADRYHQLQRFPGALLDDDGYVLFETEAAYRHSAHMRMRRDFGVPRGIRGIPGYTPASTARGGGTPMSYEAALRLKGPRIDVVQSSVERNPAARAACLEAHGRACVVCGLDFGRRFGAIGDGFIHVHELMPAAEGERSVDPVADLRPLCPNCHAMVHREDPPLSLDDVGTALHCGRQVDQFELRDGLTVFPPGAALGLSAVQDFTESAASLPAADRVRVAAVARTAAATLTDAVDCDPAAALYAIQVALARLCADRPDDVGQGAAVNMAVAGAYALCGDGEAMRIARLFDAFIEGAEGPESNVLKIRALAREVGACLTDAGPAFSSVFAAQLLAFVGKLDAGAAERITEADVAALLAAYWPTRARGRRTLEGIVAQIMLRARLFGTTEKHTETLVQQRVRDALRPRGRLLKT